MNPLSNSQNNWIGDGTAGATLSVDGNTVTLASAKRGTPFNIRRLQDDAASSFFYEIEIQEATGSLAVGIVTEEDFQPGWKTRAMLYNGNLTNGSAGLCIGFGEYPKTDGDKVGVYAHRRSADELQVIFYYNGRCLGPGFEVSSSTNDVFSPCLHLDGRAVVKFSAPETLPNQTEREPVHHTDQYSGDWRLIKAFSGPELGEVPLPANHIFLFSFQQQQADDTNTYRLSIKIGNTMKTTVKITGKLEAFDTIQVGADMFSTMMMPPPEVNAVETYVRKAAPQLAKMIVSETDGDLVMTGPTAEMIFQRYEKKFEPLTSYK